MTPEFFTVLRPLALLMLLPLPWIYRRLRQRDIHAANPWRAFIDPTLLPHLLDRHNGAPAASTRRLALIISLTWTLAVIALAGPSWRTAELPTQRPQAQAVVLLGLTESLRAQDLTPDRLTRARIAISDWMAARDGWEIGLVAYAGSAFRVSPRTTDRATLQHLVGSLDPDVMPRRGHNLASGITEALALFAPEPGPRDLLVVADHPINSAGARALTAAAKSGIRVHVVGVGSAGGAPIPTANGRFATTDDGQLRLARLDLDAQRDAAESAGARWADIRTYTPQPAGSAGTTAAEPTADDTSTPSAIAQDDGAWLLLPLLLLLALGMRRGVLWLLLPLVALPLHSPPALASDAPDWLLNPAQRSVRQWQRDPASVDVDTLPSADWRGVAAFQDGDFARAQDEFAREDTLASRYNHALSQAHADDIDGAIAGFEAVLAEQPDHADARRNLEILQAVREQQQQQPSSESSEGDDSDADDESSDRDSASDDTGAPQDSDGSEGSAEAETSPEGEPDPAEHADSQAQDAENGEPDTADTADATSDAPPESETDPTQAPPVTSLTDDPQQRAEAEEQVRQWLRRVDSDPARLLRERFRRLERDRPPPSTDPDTPP